MNGISLTDLAMQFKFSVSQNTIFDIDQKSELLKLCDSMINVDASWKLKPEFIQVRNRVKISKEYKKYSNEFEKKYVLYGGKQSDLDTIAKELIIKSFPGLNECNTMFKKIKQKLGMK